MKLLIKSAGLLLIGVLLTGGVKPAENLTSEAKKIDYPDGRVVYHASQSGWPTLDADPTGGNPFATAFIEALTSKKLRLSKFTERLAELTKLHSNGFQSIDVQPTLIWPDWVIAPRTTKAKRIALVLIISDYSASKAASLPGAEFDAKRVKAALQKAGFQTTTAFNLDRRRMLSALAKFRTASAQADAAVIYTTGHGAEIDNKVHLFSGNYPIEAGGSALKTFSYPLSRIALAAGAKKINLIFYAGCRDNPFAEP